MSTTTTCHRADVWMALEHAGTLARAEARELDAHVTSCESCRAVRHACADGVLTPRSPARSTRRALATVAGVILAAAAIAGIYVAQRRGGEQPIARDHAASSSSAEAVAPTSSAASLASIATPPTPEPSVKRDPPRAAPPPTSMAAAPATSTSALTPGQISMVLANHRREVNECWKSRERKAQAMAIRSLRVELTLSVAAAGGVERAEQRTSDRRLEEVGVCVANAAKRWRFPEMLTSSRFTTPFNFTVDPGY